VPSARRFVRATLEQLDASAAWDTLSMLLSELATNAVLHARTEFHVEIIRAADRVRVSVTDLSPVIPRQRDYAADSTTGRGMRLVDSLAVAWGVERGTDRKTVWFEVLADGDDRPAGRAVGVRSRRRRAAGRLRRFLRRRRSGADGAAGRGFGVNPAEGRLPRACHKPATCTRQPTVPRRRPRHASAGTLRNGLRI
jgi:hypothetical protein